MENQEFPIAFSCHTYHILATPGSWLNGELTVKSGNQVMGKGAAF